MSEGRTIMYKVKQSHKGHSDHFLFASYTVNRFGVLFKRSKGLVACRRFWPAKLEMWQVEGRLTMFNQHPD